jgi:hypothetical protein
VGIHDAFICIAISDFGSCITHCALRFMNGTQPLIALILGWLLRVFLYMASMFWLSQLSLL